MITSYTKATNENQATTKNIARKRKYITGTP